MERVRNYINGKWVDSKSGETFLNLSIGGAVWGGFVTSGRLQKAQIDK